MKEEAIQLLQCDDNFFLQRVDANALLERVEAVRGGCDLFFVGRLRRRSQRKANFAVFGGKNHLKTIIFSTCCGIFDRVK